MVKCIRCGRHLSNPQSIARGYGSFCATKMSGKGRRGGGPRKRNSASGGCVPSAHGVPRKSASRRMGAAKAVTMGINMMAAASPPVDALVTAYDLAKQTDEIARIANKALKKYEKTGDVGASLRSIAPEVMDMVVDEVKSQVVRAAIPGDEMQSRMARSVIRSLI